MRLARGCVVLLGVWTLAGCGATGAEATSGGAATSGGELSVADNTNAPPPRYEVTRGEAPSAARPQAERPQTGHAGRRAGTGQTAEDAISACGPQDSYTYVAAEFQCPGGGNPLGGDPMAGARARVGNVGASSAGHIIDLYRVPCPSGPVDVYVDMYGCAEMQRLLGE